MGLLTITVPFDIYNASSIRSIKRLPVPVKKLRITTLTVRSQSLGLLLRSPWALHLWRAPLLPDRPDSSLRWLWTGAFHYPDFDALKAHILTFVMAYNFAVILQGFALEELRSR